MARGLTVAKVLGVGGVLSFGVTSWLHGLHAAGLTGRALWAGGLPHIIRDGAQTLPIALLAVTVAARLARRWRMATAARAALTAIAFSLLLLPASAPHQALDRLFDRTAHAHAFHGQPRTADLAEASWVKTLALQGSEDALLGYIAALPLMLLSLAALSGEHHRSPTRTATAPASIRSSPAGFLMSTAIAWAIILVDVAALSFAAERDVHRGREGALAHVPLVTNVAVARVIDAGEVRLTLESAKWVRRPRPAELLRRSDKSADPTGGSDRIYLEVTIENFGSAPRSVGRGEFRMLGQDGAVWTSLADDFPEILLSPGERLGTSFVFEIPSEAAHLELVSSAGSAEARIPIADDDLGGVFRALCRALSRSWDG